MPADDAAPDGTRSDSENSSPVRVLDPDRVILPGRRTATYLTMSQSIAAVGGRSDPATTLAALGASPALFANRG
jgi:hypothetical protein